MASLHQVLSAMQAQVSAATTGLGITVAVGIDFPPIKALMANVQPISANKAVVAVFDRKLSRNTTRWAPIALGQAVTAATLVSTASAPVINTGGHATITLSGTITPGDAVSCVLTNGQALGVTSAPVATPMWGVVMQSISGSALNSMAAGLSAAINADHILSTWVAAAATGPVVTLTSRLATGTLNLLSLTGNGGTQITEIGRRSRELQLITWAATIENRDTVGEAIANMAQQMELFYGTYPAGLVLSDGTSGRVTVMNDFLLDDATMSDTYRRDILLTVDYPVTVTDTLFSVLMPPIMQYQVGFPPASPLV